MSADEAVERVARAIEPSAFEPMYRNAEWARVQREDATQKARYVLAALAAAPAPGDAWQPIETLPAMKRAYVGCYHDLGPDAQVERMLWRQVEAWWWTFEDKPYWSWGDTDPLYGIAPTHWHPTIEPPAPPASRRAGYSNPYRGTLTWTEPRKPPRRKP